MRDPTDKPAGGTDLWLWFGVLGGAIAWLIHLLLSYAIAEFGCVSPFRETRLWGLSGVAWLESAASVLSVTLAMAAVVVAQRNKRYIPDDADVVQFESSDPRAFMARSGVLASALFLFIILVQTLPIFYYLRNC